ncbi:protease inhibitor I42 family protein [Paenibacillus peoriae]|uniref:protease inhibitor I42 family protein n=1 Tax=Paenibacillus peoriae TaxID=59893 RepID=UPI00096D1588|nr:protease inhibitor I42 family protein [Paenibacillus peoriae]OMF31941.1 hypothetical protein BK134_12775 [Paenibacillus peoriae]
MKTQIGLESNRQSIALRLNDKLEILLPSNPSTGYMWIEKQSADRQILRLEKSGLITDKKIEHYGQGGDQYWIFGAINNGHSSIVLNYQQPWDDTTISQTFQLTIVVSK